MGHARCMLLPSKTSWFRIHLYGGSENFLSALLQVSSTSWVRDFSFSCDLVYLSSSVVFLCLSLPKHWASSLLLGWVWSIRYAHLSSLI